MVNITVEISIEDESWNKVDFDLKSTIETACLKTLEHLKIFSEDKTLNKFTNKKTCEISVLLTNNKHIQELNKQYRDKDQPTNILSFPMTENLKEELKNNEFIALGDIIIAYETIEREAEEQNKSLRNHLTHLVVHSMLHLLNYKHSKNDEADTMENKEITILKKLKIENPYN